MSKTIVDKATTWTKSDEIFRKLNGLFCLYKPPDASLLDILRKLKYSLVKGLNELPKRPTEQIVKVNEQKNILTLRKNLADTVEGNLFY